MQQLAFDQLLRLVFAELNTHRVVAIILFAFVSLTILSAGVVWPKRYTSSTTILADEKNILSPLMEGRAASTSVRNRSRIASEIIFSRKSMNRVLQEAGWLVTAPTAIELERIIEKISQSITVTGSGKNLIRIRYRDSDPVRTFETAKLLANIFIAESTRTQKEESRDAFLFVNDQAEWYHTKLINAEQRLKEFRSQNIDARPGMEAQVSNQIATLRRRIEQAKLDLRETEIKKKSLQDQLSGEAEITITVAANQRGQYQDRIVRLQIKLDDLRLSYHDDYPDIIQLKGQIEKLSADMLEDKKRRKLLREQAKASGETYIDESRVSNPLFQELRSQLSRTKTVLETLKTRIFSTTALLNNELDRGRRVLNVEATVAELTRDYEVNRDTYRDLLRRRENARISMNLGEEGQGPTFRIQEPAMLPVRPSGLRFFHFALVGIALGILFPIGLVFMLITFDPRIRSESVLSDKLKLQVLAVMPHMMSPTKERAMKFQIALLGSVVCVVAVFYISIGWLKFIQAI